MPPAIKRSKLALWSLAAVVLGSAFVGRHQVKRFIAEQRERAAGTAAPGDQRVLANAWRQGEQRRYRARLEADVTAPGGATMYQLTIEGTWQLTAVVVSRQGLELHGALAKATVQSAGKGADKAQLAELGQHLETPVLFTLDPRGTVRELSIDPKKPKLVAGLLKSLVAYGQFTEPAGTEPRWTAAETDSSGRYDAEYAIDAADANQVRRHKTRYSALIAADPSASGDTRIDVIASESRFTLDQGVVRSLKLHEVLSSKGGLIPDLRSNADFSLELVGAERLAQQQVVALRQKFDELFSALSALFRLDDDSVSEAVEQIRAGSEHSAMLRDALWNAGTSYAQQELIKLMGFFKDERDKRFTLIGLGQVQAPTKATLAYMESMFDDQMHGKQARLSFGSSAQYLKDSDPAAAEAIVAKLAQRYASATDPVLKASFIDALGNTRTDSALPAIKSALASEESLERASAVLALRHLEGDDIDAVIQNVAVSDPVPLVRNTAVSVIGERTPTAPLMQALDMLMRSDPEIMVRRSALIAGVNLKDVVPELRTTVAWVASNDPEPKLRELANDYL